MAVSDRPSPLSRENLVAMARLLAALVLAGLATYAIRTGKPVVDRVLYLGGAVALFLWGVYRREGLERTAGALPEESAFGRRQWLGLAFGLFLGLASWPAFAENRFSLLGLLLLAGAVAAVAVSCRQSGPSEASTDQHDLLDRRTRTVALLGVVLLGAFFRLYRLDTLPGDMFNDLAHIYEETQQVLNSDWMIYGTIFPGREPLLFYLNALWSRLFGLDFFTLKLSTALIGIATIPVVYWFAREAFNDAVGLVAALFLAVGKWHVLISRVGFRGILTPLVVALVGGFLLRGLRRGRRADFLWAGALTGGALYTYTAALAIIPALLLGLGLYALAGRAGDLWRMRRSLLLAALVALLIAVPMLRYMLVDGREEFWFRPITRVTEEEQPLPGPAGQILLQNLVRTAGMFHRQGDVVFRTNIPQDPHLGVLSGALFLLGFPEVLARWRRGRNALVLALFVVMLLPTALSLAFPNEVPGAVRASGGIVGAMLFPAVGAVTVWRRLGQAVTSLHTRPGWGLLLAGLALWSGLFNGRLCFVEYPRGLPAGNYPLFGEIARAIDQFGDDGPVFLKTVPHWDDRDAIRLQTRFHRNWGLSGEILPEIDPEFFTGLPVRQAAVILNPERDTVSIEALQDLFPNGITLVYSDDTGQARFTVFIFRQEEGSEIGD